MARRLLVLLLLLHRAGVSSAVEPLDNDSNEDESGGGATNAQDEEEDQAIESRPHKRARTTAVVDPTPTHLVDTNGKPLLVSMTLTLKNRNGGVPVTDQEKRTALHEILDGVYPLLQDRHVNRQTLRMFAIFIERGERNKNLHLQGVLEFLSDLTNDPVQVLKRETRWLRALIKRFCTLAFGLHIKLVVDSRAYIIGYVMKVCEGGCGCLPVCTGTHAHSKGCCEHGRVTVFSQCEHGRATAAMYVALSTDVSGLLILPPHVHMHHSPHHTRPYPCVYTVCRTKVVHIHVESLAV